MEPCNLRLYFLTFIKLTVFTMNRPITLLTYWKEIEKEMMTTIQSSRLPIKTVNKDQIDS